jgi:hypothetical protein
MAGLGATRPLAGGIAALATALVVTPSALAGPSGASGATGGFAAPAPPPPPGPPGRVLDQLLEPRGGDVPGTEYREFTTTVAAGRVRGHVVRVDLANRSVGIALLRSPVVTATATVPDLATRAGAIVGVNGDFFDEGGTGAPVGGELADGVPITSAVVPGRRPAPPGPPGSDPDTVLGIDTSGSARIDSVRFVGSVATAASQIPLTGLNTYVVPVGGVAVFTPAWGGAPRTRTVCGSDTDARAPCSPRAVEVLVRNGKVAATGPVGTAAVPAGAVALVGRDAGADALRDRRPHPGPDRGGRPGADERGGDASPARPPRRRARLPAGPRARRRGLHADGP